MLCFLLVILLFKTAPSVVPKCPVVSLTRKKAEICLQRIGVWGKLCSGVNYSVLGQELNGNEATVCIKCCCPLASNVASDNIPTITTTSWNTSLPASELSVPVSTPGPSHWQCLHVYHRQNSPQNWEGTTPTSFLTFKINTVHEDLGGSMCSAPLHPSHSVGFSNLSSLQPLHSQFFSHTTSVSESSPALLPGHMQTRQHPSVLLFPCEPGPFILNPDHSGNFLNSLLSLPSQHIYNLFLSQKREWAATLWIKLTPFTQIPLKAFHSRIISQTFTLSWKTLYQ